MSEEAASPSDTPNQESSVAAPESAAAAATAAPATATAPAPQPKSAARKSAKPSKPPKPRKSRPVTTFFFRVFITLIVLVAILAAVIQIVFWTDLPRQIAESQVRQQLGLDLKIGELEVGWGSTTRLKNVTLRLPLEEEPIIEIDSITAKHPTLVGMIFGFQLHEADIPMVRVHLRQDTAGNWNAADLVQQLSLLGQAPAEPTAPVMHTPLPKLATQIEIVVNPNNAEPIKLPPIKITGEHLNALLYSAKVDISAGGADDPHAVISARVAPGGSWKHEVSINIDHASDKKPLLDPLHAVFEGNWNGATSGAGAVGGRLVLDSLDVEGFKVSGAVDVSFSGSTLTLKPRSIRLSGNVPTEVLVEEATIRIDLDDLNIKLDNLRVAVAKGMLSADASYNITTEAGDLHVTWDQIQYFDKTNLSGSMRAEIITAIPGLITVVSDVKLRGTAYDGELTGDLRLEGEGAAYDNMLWKLTSEGIRLKGNTIERRLTDIDGLVRVTPDLIVAERLNCKAPELVEMGAGYDRKKAIAWAYVAAPKLQPQLDIPPVELFVDAWAENLDSDPRVFLKQVYARVGPDDLDIMLWAKDASLEILKGKGEGGRDASKLNAETYVSLPLGKLATLKQQEGAMLRGRLSVSGDPLAQRVKAKGSITARKLMVRNRIVDRLTAAVGIDTDPDNIHVKTLKPFQAFGATVTFDGTIEKGQGTITSKLVDLALGEIADLIDQPDMRGLIEEAVVRLKLKPNQPPAVSVDLQGRNFKFNVVEVDTFDADNIIYQNGKVFTDKPVKVEYLDGVGEVRATVSISEPDIVILEPSLTNWPVKLGPDLLICADVKNGKIKWDTRSNKPFGKAEFSSKLTYGDFDIGDVAATIELKQGENLNDADLLLVHGVKGKLIGGTIDGNLRMPMNEPLKARAMFAINGMEPNLLKAIAPAAEATSGKVSFRFTMQPSDSKRDPLPVTCVLDLTGTEAFYNKMPLGGGKLKWYASWDRMIFDEPASSRLEGGKMKKIADRELNNIALAGGYVDVWARAGLIDGNKDGEFDGLSAHVIVRAEGLDTDLLFKGLDPNIKDVPGRVDGRVSLIGNQDFKLQPDLAEFPRFITGTFEGSLTKSDLFNVPGLNDVYKTAGHQGVAKDPNGKGVVNIRYERGRLVLDKFNHIDKGIEARGYGDMPDITLGPDAKLNFLVTGILRPFKDVKLPLFANLDDMTSALQNSLLSFKVGGTASKPTVAQVALNNLSEDLRKQFTQELKDSQE